MLDRKNYKRHGYKAEDKVRLDAFRIESQQAVETAKLSYLTELGNKVNNSGTCQKSYRKNINRVINKCIAPKIPPLFVNNLFIMNCREKARYFNDYVPILRFLTNKRIDHVSIENVEIISLIRKINPIRQQVLTEFPAKCYFYVMNLSRVIQNASLVSCIIRGVV